MICIPQAPLETNSKSMYNHKLIQLGRDLWRSPSAMTSSFIAGLTSMLDQVAQVLVSELCKSPRTEIMKPP